MLSDDLTMFADDIMMCSDRERTEMRVRRESREEEEEKWNVTT